MERSREAAQQVAQAGDTNPAPDPPAHYTGAAPAGEVAPARRLREAEDRYRALVQATGQIVWTATGDGVLVDATAWRAYTGQSAEDMSGRGALGAVHPDDRPEAVRAWDQAMASRRPFEMACRLRRLDGVYRAVLIRGVPVLSEDGAVREWVGLCADVTERADLLSREQAARGQADVQAGRLEAIFETMTDGLFVFDRDGGILHLNAAARRLFALDAPSSFYTAPMRERGYHVTVHDQHGRPLPEEQWPFVRVLHGEVLTGEQAVDLHVRTVDGHEYDVTVSGAPVRDQDEQIVGAVCLVHDVTGRRQLERRTHEALDALLAMAQTLVLDHAGTEDGEEQMRAVGRKLAELTRRVLGCERVSILAVEPRTGTRHPIAAVGLTSEHEGIWQTQIEGTSLYDPHESPDPTVAARLRAGEAVVVDMTQPPWRDRPNRFAIRTVLLVPMRVRQDLVGVLSLDYGHAEHTYTAQEIALAETVARLASLVIERERLQREREEARADELAVREANRRMDEFLSIAAHELKTPLTSLKGFIQLAQRQALRTVDNEYTRIDDVKGALAGIYEMLRRTGEQINRMDRLASDLVDVTRIEAGRLEMNIVPCDLAGTVRDAVAEQRLVAPARQIALDVPDSLFVPVMADADRIGQVVTNYLTNALKYSTEDKPVDVGMSVERAMARVWVRDQGPGIVAAEQDRIWDRFYRAQGVAYRSGSGVGLGMGLYISRTIVERHGGRVGVESSPGDGSTFWFTLPTLDHQQA